MLNRSDFRGALRKISRRSRAEKKPIPRVLTAPPRGPSSASSLRTSAECERAPQGCADFDWGDSPHAFAPDGALTKIAGMTRDRAADRELGKAPRRGTLGGGRT